MNKGELAARLANLLKLVFVKPATTQQPKPVATKATIKNKSIKAEKNLPPCTLLPENAQPEAVEKIETPVTTSPVALPEKNTTSVDLQTPEIEIKQEAPEKKNKLNKKKIKKKKKKKSSLKEDLSVLNEEEIKKTYKFICEHVHTVLEFTLYLEDIMKNKLGLQIVTWLLDIGMDPDLENEHGFCLMRAAIKEQQVKIVELLLKRGASLSTWMGYDIQREMTHLEMCIHNKDNFEITKLLIEETRKQGNINDTIGMLADNGDISGETYLHLAVDRQYVKAIRALIDAGADCNARNNEGNTPLEHAIEAQAMTKRVKQHPTSTLIAFGVGIEDIKKYKITSNQTWLEVIKELRKPSCTPSPMLEASRPRKSKSSNTKSLSSTSVRDDFKTASAKNSTEQSYFQYTMQETNFTLSLAAAPANSETAENKASFDKSQSFSSVNASGPEDAGNKKQPDASVSSDLSVTSLGTPNSESLIHGSSEELAGAAVSLAKNRNNLWHTPSKTTMLVGAAALITGAALCLNITR